MKRHPAIKSIRRSRRHAPGLPVALACVALHGPAAALDYSWLGGSGSFEDASRWSLIGVPGSGDSARIPNNTGTGLVQLSSTRSIGRLWMDGGSFGGTGTLNTETLRWDFGRIGYSTGTGRGTLNLAAQTELNGAGVLVLDYSHRVNLSGPANWSIGNGILSIGSSYSTGGNAYPAAVIHIGAGTTFTEAGAFTGNDFKYLGGLGASGRTDNAGTYRREGLGTTVANNFNNLGTLDVLGGAFSFGSSTRSSSSGQIRVGAGTALFLAEVDITAGTVDNQGLVAAYASRSTIGSGAVINGQWQIISGGLLRFEGTHAVSSLAMPHGILTGPGQLVTDRLELGFARIGDSSSQAGGSLTALGPTSFDGSTVQSVVYSHRLNLRGDAVWSAGNGRIDIDSSYSQGSQAFAAAVLDIGAGTTFTDAGAATANGFRRLSAGGIVENNGTNRRQGLGATQTLNFRSNGHLNITSGVFTVDDRFVNNGSVRVAAGTWLVGASSDFRNDGLIEGDGTLQTFSVNHALANFGTLSPGAAQGIGTLTVLGDLTMTDGATLRIELGAAGLSDRLVVTDQALWNGTLALVAGTGFAPAVGDSFVIASFAQRLSGSTFDSLTWSGAYGLLFAVDYGQTDITVRVSAVPGPAAWLLTLAGLAALLQRVRRNAHA